MDKTALVTVDAALGEEVLGALDAAGIAVSVALWMYLDEYGDWRLFLASRRFDELGIREAYGELLGSLHKAGLTPERMPTVTILPMTDPLIRSLRRIFGKTKSVVGMRLGGQMIGDRFVEDAYVYRIK